MQIVHIRVGLEAPGQCAGELIIEAFVAGLMQEEVHPCLKDIRAHMHILRKKIIG